MISTEDLVNIRHTCYIKTRIPVKKLSFIRFLLGVTRIKENFISQISTGNGEDRIECLVNIYKKYGQDSDLNFESTKCIHDKITSV